MRRIVLLALLMIAIPAFTLSQVPKDEKKKMPPGKADVEQALIKLDRDLLDAMLRKDQTVADRVEVANHVFINPGGGLEVKGQPAVGPGPVIDSVDTSDAVVSVHGDTALLTGKAMVKGRFTNGPDITGPYRYMRVFVKQQGDWRLIATTVTPIKPPDPTAVTTPKN
ncbi:MAG TPA: nuclear transport factor 2 family protein [Pyrinomonadaceae bacterium]